MYRASVGTTCTNLGELACAGRDAPLHVLQELGGWKTPAMVQRYAYLAPELLAEYAERISASAPNLHQPKLRLVK